MGYKEAFCEEVTLLNSKSQEYRENGHKEKEEKMKAITKVGENICKRLIPFPCLMGYPTV